MIISTLELDDTILRTFPFSVVAMRTDQEGSSGREIWLTEAFRQCEARLGPSASHAAVKNPGRRYFKFNKKANWDVIGRKFYFKDEGEAALFRTFWC